MTARATRRTLSEAVVLVLVLVLGLRAVRAGDDDCTLPDLETFTLKTPPLEVTRPDKEWVFIDVPAQRAIAMKTRPESAVEAEYGNLEGRIYHAPSRALLSIHVTKLTGAPPDAATVEKSLRADVARRKGAELVEAGRLMLGTEEAVKADFVAPIVERPAGQREAPGGASDLYFYSRIDCVRPRAGVIVTFFFEVPKERYAKAKPGWVRLLKKMKLG